MLDLAIIGGGLSGLYLAHLAHIIHRSATVFESRSRFGGRILGHPAIASEGDIERETSASEAQYYFDLGPSWVWPEFQPVIAKVLHTHDIGFHSQWNQGNSLYQVSRDTEPQAFADNSSYESAYRISGGTFKLVEVLLDTIANENLRLNHRLYKVINHNNYVELGFTSDEGQVNIEAKQVVMTIPPRLLIDTVTFYPALDSRLTTLMRNTVTWMAGHAKAVVIYPTPFWREANLSGNVLASCSGVALGEIFDASSSNGEYAALSGFFALPAELRKRYSKDLEALILEQLVRLFGKNAAYPVEIVIKDWFFDNNTATQADESIPNLHPQYGHPYFQLEHWNGKLFFSGTETSPQFGGYLEGALMSAERTAKLLFE